ncbi:hypothetical protein VP01_14757g1, partial [Puccinia sorghi]
PFLFAFRARLQYDSARREEILLVVDSQGVWFETTMYQPLSGNWEERGRTPLGEEGERRGEKGFRGRVRVWRGGGWEVEGRDE